ncbi:DUF5988 family protein [Winogradskya humida]|uniref:Uncharacterized protein n=1 Tax=Winogradskya humida TaxID=113566 RepID=A0ABQ4A5D9_9ACTN|nr:DUF5988 family protein [Actinoplanes humidus]GIE25853.1 hypothetical protein Ahu01nite_089550 [Actinoplanes humidus]
MSAFKVMLTGGPSYVTESMRLCEVVDLADSVKLSYGNGYEHFGYTGETVSDGEEPVAVFTWKGRTKIAE